MLKRFCLIDRCLYCIMSNFYWMDFVEKEQMVEIFKKGFTYQQASDKLKERYPEEFSVPSIKPFCSKNCRFSGIKSISRQTKKISRF